MASGASYQSPATNAYPKHFEPMIKAHRGQPMQVSLTKLEVLILRFQVAFSHHNSYTNLNTEMRSVIIMIYTALVG